MAATSHSFSPITFLKVDAEGDTAIAPTYTVGDCSRTQGERKFIRLKQRAKWVDAAERDRCREKRLYFRCGAAGHCISECPYLPAVQPTKINAIVDRPLLEESDEERIDPATYMSGKD